MNIGGSNQLRNSSSILTSTPMPQSPYTGINGPNTNPPPLPPRQVQSHSLYDYRPHSLGYGYGNYGYGNNYYRNYGGYGSLGSYLPHSSGYNSYGNYGGFGGENESRFFQYAEESTRSTFQVVETVLQTFSSVTMMLESTYFAMTNSVRAILSVAENITRLRSTIGQLLSTLTLIRFVRWLCKRLMYMIGLRNQDPSHEEAWNTSTIQTVGGAQLNPSMWPGFIFLAAFVAIPYLIHKISNNVKQLQAKGADPKEWSSYDEPVYTALAQYDFVATSNEELSLRAGQKVMLAPQSLQPKNTPGWWRASDGINVGLIPHNYVNIVGQLKKKTDMKPAEGSAKAYRKQSDVAAPSNAENNQNGPELEKKDQTENVSDSHIE